MPKQKPKNVHLPVLVKEVVSSLSPRAGQSYLDLTAGYGGHASAILGITAAPQKAVLIDRDEAAVRVLRKTIDGAEVIHSDYVRALEVLREDKRRFDMVLADLGVSSPHLDEAQRGFSFNQTGPLDMRMDRRQLMTAGELVNEADEDRLAAILRQYGDEPRAKAIAGAIVRGRPVNDTAQLAAIISATGGFRSRHGRIHPATRSFQALRIAVNDELGQLAGGLPLILDVLAPGGRLAIISFHSLEDRLVKNFLTEHSGDRYDAELTELTKRPITASQAEIVSNPRARSAKLRAAAKIKNQ